MKSRFEGANTPATSSGGKVKETIDVKDKIDSGVSEGGDGGGGGIS